MKTRTRKMYRQAVIILEAEPVVVEGNQVMNTGGWRSLLLIIISHGGASQPLPMASQAEFISRSAAFPIPMASTTKGRVTRILHFILFPCFPVQVVCYCTPYDTN